MLSSPTIVSLKARVELKTERVVKVSKLLEYKPAKLASREIDGCYLINSSFCISSKDGGISELSGHAKCV